MEAQSQLWGVNFLESMLTDDIMEELDPLVPELHGTYCRDNADARRYLIAHTYLGSQLAENERLKYLGALTEDFTLDLYTLSDAGSLPKAQLHPDGANTLTEMPLIFHNSRINMNITMRPIATGLSLRLYDVCGCGGFLLTNYQEELPELYEPGTEVETFSSVEEMRDKAAWYLDHENDGRGIILAGFSQGGEMCLELLKEYYGGEGEEAVALRDRLIAV